MKLKIRILIVTIPSIRFFTMGKKDFAYLYTQIRTALGLADNESCTIKVSGFSNRYDPSKNYAGIIVYHHNGMCRWENKTGVAEGYKCRSFYVLILCTDKWTDNDFRRAGQGYVHDKMYKDLFGGRFEDGKSCCGGFAILKGATRYSSHWLNDQSSHNRFSKWAWGGYCKWSWESDGSHILSRDEKAIVNQAISTWKREGPNSVTSVPRRVDRRLQVDV